MQSGAVPAWAAVPFVVLLVCIATLPLLKRQWWERYYPAVAVGLAMVTVVYYLFFLHNATPLLESGFEYISFIALIGSLFVIAGGIHIRLRGRSRPLTNVIFLAIGALVANLVGTTGASIIMIRPFIRVNNYRIKPYHVIFFIFIVSNVGGALTPIGDPPLFIGYLKGIPFFWSIVNLWYIWLFAVAAILVVFYIIDRREFSKLNKGQQEFAEETGEEGEVTGLHNIIFLVIVLVAVFIQHPIFLREAIMVAAAAGSYFTTRTEIHKKNDFNFVPIKEVAILFVGIFMTMVPALEWISQNAARFGLDKAGQFYWATGSLSSVLDNTPTYLNFLSAAFGVFVNHGVVQHVFNAIHTHGAAILPGRYAGDVRSTVAVMMTYHPSVVASGAETMKQVSTAYLLGTKAIIVQAISIGAVFFGAMTYIGNGPNFLVKSISEQAGVECPSFVSYILKYALPILLPILFMTWFIFFRT